MPDDKKVLTNLRSINLKSAAFSDGMKGRVLRFGTLKVPGITRLEDVLMVEGLKANLTNISQLYDQDLYVQFTKNKCNVLNR